MCRQDGPSLLCISCIYQLLAGMAVLFRELSHVSLVEFSMSGFKEKNVLHPRSFTNLSVSLIGASIYCFSLHVFK